MHLYSWVEACKALGLARGPGDEERIAELVRSLIGLAPIDIAYTIAGDISTARRLADVKQEIYMRNLDRVKLFPGVREGLAELKRMGMRIAIASSVHRKTIEVIAKLNNIEQYIDAYIGSDEVSKRKPDPEIFLKALERIGVEPNRAVIVGDTEYDIAPANTIGAISILICWRKCLETKTKPSYTAKNIDEVVDIIRRLIQTHHPTTTQYTSPNTTTHPQRLRST